MKSRNEDGFTLVELSTSMTAGIILLLAFTSVLVFSREEASATAERVSTLRDGWMLDRYLRNTLAETVGDSVLIYADLLAEASDTPSSSGTILKTVDPAGNTYRIAASNQNLVWQENGVTQYPVDAQVLNLAFQRTDSPYGRRLNLDISFLSAQDTVTYGWIITFRN